MDNADSFLQIMKNRWKLNLYLLTNLPSAFFSGVRVRKIEKEYAEVSVPYIWFSRNPFRSTYFACLSMGAEMSTGILALMYIYGIKPEISMLVTELECQFHKKAVGTTRFTCYDGNLIRQAIQ
ncbi:MAG: thioesterase, partial [Chitinophagaceae bacterium]